MSLTDHPEKSARHAAIDQVASDWEIGCAHGVSVSVEDLLTSHPELAPDLEQEVRRRAKIEAARAAAKAQLSATESALPPLSPSHISELGAMGDDDGDERPAIEIPGYEILREIHRGGQGVVYQAVQTGTKRKVAIKVLLEGPYASRSARRRFEREIEVVGQLKHPNIISIFHSGETPDGRQYCVMDYLRGDPLVEHVRKHNFTLEDTLKLIAKVCEAVQYAHQRGVIHRDLKPSNVLVDVNGQPKVLDFGLAKLAVSTHETVVSESGKALGTLAYMSPEQVRGNPDEIDMRTDVYSIGVMLYQALTGADPYPLQGSWTDTARHIQETNPAPLKKKWQQISGVCAKSRSRSGRTRCPISNELQTIVFQSLSKDRVRRYQSAGELGADLLAFLEQRPIKAKKASAIYVLRKLARRHVYSTCLVVLVLIVFLGSVFSVVQSERRSFLQTQEHNRDLKDMLDERAMENEGLIKIFHTLRLETFLAEWQAGQQGRARRIMEQIPAGLPERTAMTFLSDPSMEEAVLLEKLGERSMQLAYFVIGERRLRSGNVAGAEESFQASLAMPQGAFHRDLAQARISEIRQGRAERAPERE